jgi:hypothetical protein
MDEDNDTPMDGTDANNTDNDTVGNPPTTETAVEPQFVTSNMTIWREFLPAPSSETKKQVMWPALRPKTTAEDANEGI